LEAKNAKSFPALVPGGTEAFIFGVSDPSSENARLSSLLFIKNIPQLPNGSPLCTVLINFSKFGQIPVLRKLSYIMNDTLFFDQIRPSSGENEMRQ
jgi:hypothetical protein